jgi:lactoylglutathione lyase
MAHDEPPAAGAATELFPILETPDLARSLGFYRDLLGGTVAYEFRGPEGDVVYAGIDIGRSHLGIGLDTKATTPPSRVILWIYVDDCDALIASLRAAGVTVLEEPVDQPWGERVGLVEDPDGVRVRIADRAPASRSGSIERSPP